MPLTRSGLCVAVQMRAVLAQLPNHARLFIYRTPVSEGAFGFRVLSVVVRQARVPLLTDVAK